VLDIGGALMLAVGLAFRRPEVSVEEATNTFGGYSPAEDVARATQTADAQIGAGLLTLGFVLQLDSAIGWHKNTGWVTFGIAVGAAALFDLAAWLFLRCYWRRTRPEFRS
jgi:hypothetical protein